MAKIISVKETNKKLSEGVIPSSLDLGFIPSADKFNECLRAQSSKGNPMDQVDKLIEEIKTTSAPIEKKDRGRSLYVIDDYDEDEDEEDDGELYHYTKSKTKDQDFNTSSSLPSGNGFGKIFKSSGKKISKVKKAIQSKFTR
ncbi:hypothetical protein K502DRAFT_349232 [Neoconidiobolus thromboides FSU 785]|nr:hypothetical protein K502DRAFT_349232 [Neoconidiobolus thromboides FSU 785]